MSSILFWSCVKMGIAYSHLMGFLDEKFNGLLGLVGDLIDFFEQFRVLFFAVGNQQAHCLAFVHNDSEKLDLISSALNVQ